MKKYLFGFIAIFILILFYPLQENKEINSAINKTVFIDPGHGGYDPGTNSDDILEKEINLKIGSYLYEKLLANSFQAYITRSEDYDLSSLNSKNHKQEDLNNRVKAINNSGADILVSIHLNALLNPTVYGPMVYYRKNDDESQKLAQIVQDELNDISGLKKKIHPETYFLFKHTSIPAILIECGFLSNEMERKLLNTSNYQQKLANAIFNSLLKYDTLL